MSIFSLFKKKDKEINPVALQETNDDDEITAVIASVVASMEDDQETVAAITAAIACMLGKSTSDFVVRNIKRTSEIDSLWALQGIMKLMR